MKGFGLWIQLQLRRIGSRFLEVLEAGCIPVLLANDWELPLSEVIDWSQAAVIADERTLSRLPDLLRNLPDSQIVKMREQVRFIWNSYFCSVDAIVHATLMVRLLESTPIHIFYFPLIVLSLSVKSRYAYGKFTTKPLA